jgi:phospholipid/cholesterol/gamma-HCH transport system substrate-binding protein
MTLWDREKTSMNRSKEIKIGLIVTSGIVLLVWGLNFLKGRDFFSSQRKVFAVYDHVDGLAASNLVQVNGLKVGSVTKLSLLPDYSGRILVTMTIKSDLHIPRIDKICRMVIHFCLISRKA